MSRSWKIFLIFLSVVVAFAAGRMIPGRLEAGPQENTAENRSKRIASRTAAFREHNAAGRTLALLDELARCETADDFREMITAIETRADKTEKQRFFALLFGEWLARDPAAALSEVRRVELLRHDPTRVSQVFTQWAANNPGLAAGLLFEALDGRQNDPAAVGLFLDGVDSADFMVSLISGLGSTDPALAGKTLAASAESHIRTTSIEVLLQGWYAENPSAVHDWAAAIKDPSARLTAVTTAATKAGQLDDTAAGISWAMNLPTAEKQAALASLTSAWSARRSIEAFEWTSSLTDEDLKLAIMPGVLRNYAMTRPGSAADWLNQYEASPVMDANIAAYAKAIAPVNTAAALGSAEAITDPALRQSVIASIRREFSE